MSDTIKLQVDNFSGLIDVEKKEALQRDKIQRILLYLIDKRGKVGTTDDMFIENSIDVMSQILGEDLVCSALSLTNRTQTRTKYRIVNSYDNAYLTTFGRNLKINGNFDTFVSVKVTGVNIDLVYEYGDLTKIYLPFYFSAYKDITEIVLPLAEKCNILNIEEWIDMEKIVVHSKIILPIDTYNDYIAALNIQSDYIDVKNAILQILESKNYDIISKLHILSFDLVSEGFVFASKYEVFEYLEELHFELPMFWLISDMNLDTIVLDIHNTLVDCEEELYGQKDTEDVSEPYPYFTEGIIVSIDDMDIRKNAIIDGRYSTADLLVQLEHWKPDIFTAVVQTICWKSSNDVLRPYAVVTTDYDDTIASDFILDSSPNSEGVNIKGTVYKEIPLYNPYLILLLDAYAGFTLNFTISKHLGAIPCMGQIPLMEQSINSFIQ